VPERKLVYAHGGNKNTSHNAIKTISQATADRQATRVLRLRTGRSWPRKTARKAAGMILHPTFVDLRQARNRGSDAAK
jgi:hypothetical protein